MQVNYYRHSNDQGYEESWQACHFTPDTDLSRLTVKPLVTINGQPYLRQHHITYLTGRETCRAHHFAKHLAIQVLNATQSSQSSPSTPSTPSTPSSPSSESTPSSESSESSELDCFVNNSLTLPTHPLQ